MMLQKFPYVVALAGVWLGFVCAISFMEAWLKFRAPGINVSLGLGIGRLVFNALNKVEWVCFILILLQLLFHQSQTIKVQWVVTGILFVLLISQTFWLLPILDSRAELIINEQPLPPSNFHFYYVFLELVKVATLVFILVKMIARSEA